VEGKADPRTRDIDGWLAGFFRGLRYAAEEAEKNGLELWLFDEWGYPTGTAAGKAMAGHTEWRSKKLHIAMDLPLEQGQRVSLEVPPHFLCASVWKVGRDIFSAPLGEAETLTPVEGRLTYTARHKRERLCVVTWEYDCFRTVGVFEPDPEEDSYGTLDLMCHEAVAYFISQMHERYVPLLGDLFGKAVKGFFYDEPYLSFPAAYTFDIMEQFAREKGYDILPLLPLALAGHNAPALRDYRDICTTRVAEAFFGQMAEWAHRHSLEMVGHQDLDHRARSLDTVSGHFFKNSAKSDGPGVDYIWAQILPGGFTDFPRYAGSARRILGKSHAVSESFAAVGRSMFPDYMRFCMEHQILRGIDRFFLMIADPVPEGAKFDTPLSQKHPQSQAFGAALNRRVALTNRLLNAARPVGGVALYIPMAEIFSASLRQGASAQVNYSPYAPAWEYVEQAAEVLAYLPVDFDYLWREALLELPVEQGALVTPGGQRIHTVILPPVTMQENQVPERLAQLIRLGVRVIFLNSAPATLLGQGEVCPTVKDLRGILRPDAAVEGASRVSVAVRQEGERRVFAFLNEDTGSCEAFIAFPGEGRLQRFDYARESWVDLEEMRVPVRLEGMQAAIFSVGGEPAGLHERKAGAALQTVTGWTAVTPQGEVISLGEGLTDWRGFYPGDYSGWMTYYAELEAPRAGSYRVDLGRVCWAARVTVGGQTKPAAFAPYTADFELPAGTHKITVEVLNTPANEAVGTPVAEERGLQGGWMRTQIGNDRNYLISGLLGPVTLHAISDPL
jgi:hypothetical protein